MKKFTFKRQLLFVMLMLLGCLSIQAADDGLITNQVVITLDEPGTLPQKINDYEKNFITSLKVKGKINGTDLRLIREMAGGSVKGEGRSRKPLKLGFIRSQDCKRWRLLLSGQF